MADFKVRHEDKPAHFPNLAKTLMEGRRMKGGKSALVAQHKYSNISFLH